MLVSGATAGDILLKVISPEGQTYVIACSEETLIEDVKNRAIDYFYPNGAQGASRYKLVRVFDTCTLHDFLTIAQEEIGTQEELLLVERRLPEAGALWDLGAVRAPQQSAIAAATASLPPAHSSTRQPNLQSLLSTNELSHELRKILISLVEAGARLAAAGRNYRVSLAQLSAALEEPQRNQSVAQVITPEGIAARLQPEQNEVQGGLGNEPSSLYDRATHLQRFLDKFRAWKARLVEPPNAEAIAALGDLGFGVDEATEALRRTGCNVPAAASWLVGERGGSVFELVDGLPDGLVLSTLLSQAQIQRGLLNTRMLLAFIHHSGGKDWQRGTVAQFTSRESTALAHLAHLPLGEVLSGVNQFSDDASHRNAAPSTSRQRR